MDAHTIEDLAEEFCMSKHINTAHRDARIMWALVRAREQRDALRMALEVLLPMVEECHEEFPRDVGDKEAPAIAAAHAAIFNSLDN